MASIAANISRPIVRMMGRQLSSPATAQGVRAAYDRWTKMLLTPLGVKSEKVTLGGRPCLKSTPKHARSDAVLLYFHGGGYIFGTLDGYRCFPERFGKAAGLVTYMPDYRLAPEHPFPAALDDAVAAYEELLKSYDASKIAIGGDSAGGGLSLALLHRLRDEGRPLPNSAFLLSPWTDLTLSGDSHKTNATTELVVPEPLPTNSANFYAGDTPKNHPSISPAFGSHKGLPPLLVQISTNEILWDDAKNLVEKARGEGVDVTYQPYEDMWHDWHLMAPLVPEANKAIADIGAFVKSHLP
ncbi:MAG: alpha/beta hydrolase [Sphingomonadales bacterium]